MWIFVLDWGWTCNSIIVEDLEPVWISVFINSLDKKSLESTSNIENFTNRLLSLGNGSIVQW